MRVNAKPEEVQFDLEGAVYASLQHDRTLWLQNYRFSSEIDVGDLVCLWSSGVKNTDRSIGRLVALATVVTAPTKHPQHDWQAAFRRREVYDPAGIRMKLKIESIIDPPVRRSEVMLAYPEARTRASFFRNGSIRTMERLESATESVLLDLARRRRLR